MNEDRELERELELARMVAYWGPRCEDFDMECPACRAWTRFDLTGTAPDVRRPA